MLLGLWAAGCKEPPDPAWEAAGKDAVKVAGECAEIAESAANRCADAMAGAATMPASPMKEAEACKDRFHAARTAFDDHPSKVGLQDLSTADAERLGALMKAVSDASGVAARLRLDAQRLCSKASE